MKVVESIILLVTLIFSSQIIAKQHSTHVCEGEVFTATCESGQVLAIDSANYGRTNASICTPNKETSCHLKETVAVLNKKCFGKKYCSLVLDDTVFQDPCPGVPKYLDVTYTCTDEENVLEACKQYMVKLGDKPAGYIKSTNYPSKYNEKQDCVIKLNPRQGYKYDITLLDLDVENRSGQGCYDWLVIKDDENPAKHFNYCGKYGDIHTDEPAHVEQIDNVVITFMSDAMTSRRGFIIKYQEVPAKMAHEEF